MLRYVPIQAVNQSLEEVKFEKQTYFVVASPIQVRETQQLEGYNVNTVQRGDTAKLSDLDRYLKESWRT